MDETYYTPKASAGMIPVKWTAPELNIILVDMPEQVLRYTTALYLLRYLSS